MAHRSLFALVFATALLGRALGAQSGAHPDGGAAEEVKATLVAMWAAIEAGDVERYASFVHPAFTQFGESDVYLSSGKAEEVRGIAGYLQRARQVHTVMHQPEVTVRKENGRWLCIHGHYTAVP